MLVFGFPQLEECSSCCYRGGDARRGSLGVKTWLRGVRLTILTFLGRWSLWLFFFFNNEVVVCARNWNFELANGVVRTLP